MEPILPHETNIYGYVLPTSQYGRYELYYYSGALCNIYMKWVESGLKETPEEIAMVLVSSLEK